MKQNRQAFTLIELLIVVAIIAILAAIAVPNFLEAQARAKVSRAKSDMRAIIVAEEAYMLDWNTYTGREWNMQVDTYREGLRRLTSPIAYIARVPFDSFGTYADEAWRAWSKPKFEFSSGNAATQVGGGPDNALNPRGWPADACLIRSVGPDKVDDTYEYPWGTVNQYWWEHGMSPNTGGSAVAAACAMLYDPTNGTVSVGDVHRVGGAKPAGPAYDVLFAHMSK